jgi:hypothetical protein
VTILDDCLAQKSSRKSLFVDPEQEKLVETFAGAVLAYCPVKTTYLRKNTVCGRIAESSILNAWHIRWLQSLYIPGKAGGVEAFASDSCSIG